MVNSSRHRGAAMAETVLVLPLIFVVLALLFFFGQAMTRLQRSSATDRYEAWRQAQYAPGPGVGFAKNPVEFDDNNMLNEAFFAGNAERVDIGQRTGRVSVSAVTETLTDRAYLEAHASTDPLYDPSSAEDYVRELLARAPAWWRIDLETEHTSDVPLYQRYAGAVKHQHTVIDGDWSYVNWIEQLHRGLRDQMGPVLDEDVHFMGRHRRDGNMDLYDMKALSIKGLYYTYYEDVEQPLEALDEQDNPLASAIRGIYINIPAYIGPIVLPEIDWYMMRLDTTSRPDAGDEL